MKHAIIALTMLVAGCASEPKEAHSWQTKTLSSGPIVAELNKTGGKKAGTIIYLGGLGESTEAPRKSLYGSEHLVIAINASGYSHVLSVGYPADLLARLPPASFSSDPVYMIHPGAEAATFAKQIRALILKENLPRPIIGLSISMGSYNTLTLAGADASLFDKIILMNPMILGPEQWSNAKVDWIAWLKAGHKFEDLDAGLMPGNHFTREEWAQAAPLAQLARTEKFPPIFVTACESDEFKLYPPTLAWVTEAQKRFSVEFSHKGGCRHVEPDTAFVAEKLK